MNPFGDLLKLYAERNPRGGAIYYGMDRKETWKELNDRTNGLANALYDLGIRKDDKGIVMLHNCPELIESYCALLKIGAVVSPMNWRLVPREIEYQTNNSDAKIFITADKWLENVKNARSKMPKVTYPISGFGLVGDKGEALHNLYYAMRKAENTSFIELFTALVIEGAKKRGMEVPNILTEEEEGE